MNYTDYHWPSFEQEPPLPDHDLDRKQKDGERAGYPRHLCHLLRYGYVLGLPNTSLTRSYLEWYCSSSNSLPVGLLLVNYADFERTWGTSEASKVDQMISNTGRPPIHWYLISKIVGYSLNTDVWNIQERHRAGNRATLTAEEMTLGAVIGAPVHRLL